MANKKFTKRALFGSVIALILCCAMLVGTTFAWFTDSASSSVNTIVSGTLDVKLLAEDGITDLEGETLNFVKNEDAPEGEDILWEPGCTYNLQPVMVKNAGSLALKYQLTVTGFEGDAKLLDAIEWTITVDDGAAADGYYTEGNLAAGESNTIVISGHMKEEADNDYQGLTLSNISITVVAGQDTVEYDSFTDEYDASAPYTDAANPPAGGEGGEGGEGGGNEDVITGENNYGKDDVETEGDAVDMIYFNGKEFDGAKTTITETVKTVYFENCTGNPAVHLTAYNTVFFDSCDFTLAEGEKVVTSAGGFNTNCQVVVYNCKINGEAAAASVFRNYVDSNCSVTNY